MSIPRGCSGLVMLAPLHIHAAAARAGSTPGLGPPHTLPGRTAPSSPGFPEPSPCPSQPGRLSIASSAAPGLPCGRGSELRPESPGLAPLRARIAPRRPPVGRRLGAPCCSPSPRHRRVTGAEIIPEGFRGALGCSLPAPGTLLVSSRVPPE